MHELSLAQSVVDCIKEQALKTPFERVERVILEVGALSCVEPEALAFSFDSVTRGTIAEGAALDIETPSGKAQCFGCGRVVNIENRGDSCPHCGSHQLVVAGGDELKIKALEVV